VRSIVAKWIVVKTSTMKISRSRGWRAGTGLSSGTRCSG